MFLITVIASYALGYTRAEVTNIMKRIITAVVFPNMTGVDFSAHDLWRQDMWYCGRNWSGIAINLHKFEEQLFSEQARGCSMLLPFLVVLRKTQELLLWSFNLKSPQLWMALCHSVKHVNPNTYPLPPAKILETKNTLWWYLNPIPEAYTYTHRKNCLLYTSDAADE